MRESAYEAWQRRQRRRAMARTIGTGAVYAVGALALAFTLYLALVGFLVVFG